MLVLGHDTIENIEMYIVTILGVGFGSDELGEILVNVHLEMLLLYCLIMYDEWRVIGDILCLVGLGYV
jgi:hypothetical protein